MAEDKRWWKRDKDSDTSKEDVEDLLNEAEAKRLQREEELAEAEHLKRRRGQEPVLLLDDVLSEIDGERRGRVLEKATQYEQTMITTTDLEQAQSFFGRDAKYFRVSGGGVTPCP